MPDTRSSRASKLATAGTVLTPAGRAATGVLPGDPRRVAQGPADPAAGHPVLDELPHPDLQLADRARPRGHRRVHRRPHRRPGLPDPRDPVARSDRPRLRLPAADDLPALRDAGADGSLAGRGIQGSRRRALGDLPPDHPADRAARPDHRQHPRVHPDDGRVRGSGHPGLRADVPDRQRAGPGLPRGAQLAAGCGQGRHPDRDHAGDDHRSTSGSSIAAVRPAK